MSTVTRHYKHGRLELHQGSVWWVYVETDRGIEFLDTRATLPQAEELYCSWYEA